MYEVMYHNQCVGYADVEIQGLYYAFTCSCSPPKEGIYRLIVSNGNRAFDLGICVPEGGQFMVRKRMPTKRFDGVEFYFKIISKDDSFEYIPVESGMIFPHLDKLRAARMQNTNGQPMLIIERSPIR